MEQSEIEHGKVDLETSLIDTVVGDNLKEIIVEGSELALDHFLSEGILKEIPFFGVFYKSVKAVAGIRENIFAKKVFKFLAQLKTIPKGKRETFISKLENQKEYKHKVGEKIIVLLDQLDDLDKPSIIGRLFKFAILERISYEDFLRLSSIVHRAFLPDLNRLNQHYDLGREAEEHFANLGIMTMKLEETKMSSHISLSQIRSPFIYIRYELNSLGKKLREYGFEDETIES